MTSNSNVILKTIMVLKAFTDKQTQWGVNELSRYLDFPVSSLHRILKTLREEEILQVHPQSGKYIFGSELVRISSIVNSKSDIKVITEPNLKRLSQTLDETIYLALYYPQHMKLSFVHNVQSSAALQYLLELGVLQPIHIAASGKAILAFLSHEEIENILEQEGVGETEKVTILSDLDIIRQLGYSFSESERKQGSIGIGAPIFNSNNLVIGSIICAIPANLYDESKKDFIVQQVVKEANNISYNLGCQR
ncbi:IclR family transcriptional regulator [Metabacillus bambusae]|uniref:IclR family transcriptional regulator n=1 Tax=Metabacillus bambusae TaxID=2795218 RepID=A0ABS3N6Z3_9BACI|nr:IclR family transcriptional regulator [Metabacillus bambusae]MBO1514056.1 IclR family transcriptional regulator [Metabacillus bambusae]